MIINLPSGRSARLIGDPHLAKKFERGVPVHRRGEREKSQFAQFVSELNTPNLDFNITMGDVFEHPHVSPAAVVAAAEAYLAAAESYPGTVFIVLAGNHDLPRDLKTVGAWQIFCRIVEGRRPNLLAVSEPTTYGELLLMPWQWGVAAADQVPASTAATVCMGHWDLQSFGGDDSHLCPTQELAALGIETIYSGHYHLPGEYKVAGKTVICTGSMQPMSHAEDPEGKIYVTLTLAEATDGRDLHDKFVRLLLAPGEVEPEDLDCLSLIRRAAPVESEEVHDDGDFDWAKIMKDALSDLTPEVRDFIKERLSV